MHVSTLAMTPRVLGITSSFFSFHSEAEVANGCRHERPLTHQSECQARKTIEMFATLTVGNRNSSKGQKALLAHSPFDFCTPKSYTPA